MKLFVFPSFSSRSGASMKKMFFLLLLFFPFLYAQNPHQVVKNIQGKGLTYREARIQAFRNAIEQTSVALESFSLSKNFEIVLDIIISSSQGIIVSYKLSKHYDTQCAFQFHQEGTSEYSIKTNGNLRQLLETLMKIGCFDESNYKYDQPRRILELSYLSSSSAPAPSSSPPAFEEGRLKRYQRNFQEAILALSLALKEMEPTHSDVASAYMLRGDCYFYLDELEKAIADYKEAIRFSPDSDIGLVSQGNLLFIQEQY
jgi:tetratricopeptide (TPR) repeat protein